MNNPASLRIALVGPATLEMLQHLFESPIASAGYPFPILPTLAQEYMHLGHDVIIITTASDITTPLIYEASGIELRIVPMRERARSRALDLFAHERRNISQAIQAAKPDIVHAHWTYEFALAAASAAAAPVLVTARDAPLTILRRTKDPYRLLRTVMAYRARCGIGHLTAVSPYLAGRWRKEMLYRRPITVIPNPIFPLPRSPLRRAGTPVVLDVASGGRLKNVRTLIVAFSLVRLEVPKAQLRLVGPGLEVGSVLWDWARREGLDQGVTFVGKVSRLELADEYARATVFCHPSLEESFGNVLLEALQSGLPVIAGSQVGGVPWVLMDGRAGLLVDVSDPRSIATAVAAAIRDPASTVALDLDLAAELHKRYAPESVARQYLAAYRRVLARETAGESR